MFYLKAYFFYKLNYFGYVIQMEQILVLIIFMSPKVPDSTKNPEVNCVLSLNPESYTKVKIAGSSARISCSESTLPITASSTKGDSVFVLFFDFAFAQPQPQHRKTNTHIAA